MGIPEREPTSDVMGVKLKFNSSKKRKGIRIKPNISLADLDSFRKSSLTKRQVLGLTNGIYDPLGIASPYSIKLKLLMRTSLMSLDRQDNSKKSWDSSIQDSLVEDWSRLIQEGIQEDMLLFNRSGTPAFPAKLPKLIGFFDGSSEAFASVIYVRWKGRCARSIEKEHPM